MIDKDCIFCQLVVGEKSTNKVYEDDYAFAFMDMHPIQPGHVLVIPKKHVPDFYKLDNNTYTELFLAVKKISQAVNGTEHPKKVGLIVAGFDVPHAHIHVVPMHEYHDITSKALLEGNHANPSNDELAIKAEKIIQAL